ncbi:MAG: alpha/beta fold hydrolase [Actinomycetota bacterium]|nr:alpha/beta fold hydrolase [Actinomycetota bacterium]
MRVDEHTIEVAGAPVFYRSAGASGTPALYLHGIPTSSDDFLPFLERSGGIAPDLIGFGRSTKAGNLEYTLESQADFVQELLGALELDRVQLVVHDWGVAGGLIFAQRHPERIERLVVCNALPLLEGFSWRRYGLGRLWRRPIFGELAMGSVNRWLLARTLRQGSVSADAWSPERLDAVWAQFDQGTQRAILRLHRDGGEPQLAAAGAELEQLRMPSLVIWGEADPWFGPAYGEAYAARLGNAELRRIPDAGHWPWLDQPSVIELVAAFLG